jgi:hypothetical protein
VQGQIANLDTYAHICFAAASLSCALHDEPVPEGVEKAALQNVFDQSMMAFAVGSLVAVLAGNARRALCVYRYIGAQPTVHKLMPNAFRNIQMAWICNFWTTAVFLEATSLSDYMVRLGHPVEAERQQRDAIYRYPPPPPPRVESIARPLVMDKLKYQDLPMLALLLLHFVASIAGYSRSQTVSIV